MYDPIGPGTSAWNAYERALMNWARAQGGPQDPRKNKAYKAYWNSRGYMIERLKIAGASQEVIAQWVENLKRDHGCVDIYGEWIN